MTNVIVSVDNDRKAKLAASAIARAASLKQEQLARKDATPSPALAHDARPGARWLAFLMTIRKR